MIIKVRVQPKSSKSELVETGEGEYKAYLSSAPVDGKANEELVRLLTKELGVKKYNIEIITGLTGRNKIVRIEAS